MQRTTSGQLFGGLLVIAGFCIVMGFISFFGAGIPGRSRFAVVQRVHPEAIALSQRQGMCLMGAGFCLGLVTFVIAGFSERGLGPTQGHMVRMIDRYQTHPEGTKDFGPNPLPGYATCARVQFEDGTTEEVTVDALLYTRIMPGQRGTALLRGSRLLQFHPAKPLA